MDDFTLQGLEDRHEQVARYRVYLFDPRRPRGQQREVVDQGLRLAEARAKVESLNKGLRDQGLNRFADPLYGLALSNPWECLTPAARQRMLLLGKAPGDAL